MRRHKPDYEEIARLEAELFGTPTPNRVVVPEQPKNDGRGRSGGRKDPNWPSNRPTILRSRTERFEEMAGFAGFSASATSDANLTQIVHSPYKLKQVGE